MDKQKIWAVVGVAVVALALVAGALLTRGSEERAGTTGASQESTATAEGSSADTSAGVAGSPSGPAEEPAPRTVDPNSIVRAPSAGGTPAEAGSELATVTTPPAQTLAMVSTTSGAAGDTFRVSFRPYGPGPVRADGPTLVVRIDSSLRSNTNESRLVIPNGTNAMVLVAPSQADAVSVGGTYTGTIELVPSSGALALRLTDASLERE